MKTRKKLIYSSWITVSCLICASWAPPATAADSGSNQDTVVQQATDEDFKRQVERLERMSLAELLNADVTSVSKKKEQLFDAAAAVYVIDSNDIRRSGARSIPEALRMAPGISVGQVSANTWAITSRGFAGAAGRLADKLLVLVDGRPVYHNNGNGVFWQVQDYVLEDIDRIEVVRGPGGTLWGANAVNGVINIITKDSADTEGGYITGGGGTEDRAFASVRYAVDLSDDAFARFYAKYRNRADYPFGRDGSHFGQMGWRSDWHSDFSHLTWQGDGFVEEQRASAVIPDRTALAPGANKFPFTDTLYKNLGGNTVLTYQRELADESDVQLRAYYDFAVRKELGTTYENHNFDLDFQHRFPIGERHDTIYGLEYRFLPMRQNDNALVQWRDPQLNYQLFSAFVQDEIELVTERVWLTLGSKFEHNDFTGFEVQPNARMRWKPGAKQTVWGAVSRAVQVPGPTLQGARLPALAIETGFPGAFVGSAPGFRTFPATVLIAYELGYRVQPTLDLSLDIAAFYNDYDKLPAGVVDFTTDIDPGPAFVAPVFGNSSGEGQTYGFEVSSRWQAQDWWRLTANYSFLESRMNAFISAGQEPEHMVSLQSSFDLPNYVELDVWGRWVSQLYNFGTVGTGSTTVPGYFDLDIRLGWQPQPNMEWSIVGQNLISAHRQEFGANRAATIRVARVPRGVYAQFAYKF